MSKHFSSSYCISFANISLPKASHMAKTRVRWEGILAIFAKKSPISISAPRHPPCLLTFSDSPEVCNCVFWVCVPVYRWEYEKEGGFAKRMQYTWPEKGLVGISCLLALIWRLVWMTLYLSEKKKKISHWQYSPPFHKVLLFLVHSHILSHWLFLDLKAREKRMLLHFV